MTMHIESIDHIVLTFKNIEATCTFYMPSLGMEVVTFGAGRKSLLFGAQKINLHEQGNEFAPTAQFPTPGRLICALQLLSPSLKSSHSGDRILYSREPTSVFLIQIPLPTLIVAPVSVFASDTSG